MKKTMICPESEFWLQQFLETQKQLNRSSFTLVNYEADLRKFLLWAQFECRRSLRRLRPCDMTRYMIFLEAGGEVQKRPPIWWPFAKTLLVYRQPALKVASRKRHFSALRQFFEYLSAADRRRGWFRFKTPIVSILHTIQLKEQDTNPTTALRPEAFARLFELATKLQDRLALALLFFGGIRLSELVSIRVDSIHFSSHSIVLRRKGGRVHTLRIEQFGEIEPLILAHLKRRKKASEWLFAGIVPERPITARAMAMRLERLLKKLANSTDLTPHSFRKGRATLLYQKTRDLLFVRDYLNHRDAKVTQNYIDTQYLWEHESLEVKGKTWQDQPSQTLKDSHAS
jgi:integrase/recombinase XerD